MRANNTTRTLGMCDRMFIISKINTLTSVVIMLCGAKTIDGDVNHSYVKQQLYADRLESIPQEDLSLHAKIINTLRPISWKRD